MRNGACRIFTDYPDVDAFIDSFAREIVADLAENTVGVYLTGSITYGAFKYGSSDIDITVVVKRPVRGYELSSIAHLHSRMEEERAKWSRRFECSYTPLEMLTSVSPPAKPRPWYWGGDRTLYPEAPYGNEWIINAWYLYESSIALHGPAYRDIAPPVELAEVQMACVRDLLDEWAPKRFDPGWFRDSHHESYLVLNLCRIFHTVMCGSPGSKSEAANWARQKAGDRWRDLIDRAANWEYGVEVDLCLEAMKFLDYVIAEVSKTPLYHRLQKERA